MADISSIKLNDTTYNIKDETARNNINSISTNLNSYLPLTGGTVTGTIIMTNDGAFRVKNDVFDKTVVPASNVEKSPFNVRDVNDATIASVRVHQTTDNEIGIGLNALSKNVLTAYVKNDNNKTVRYSIENPDAFCNAANAVNKSGDTMTGTLRLASVGLATSSEAGYDTDQYGNIRHLRDATGDIFSIKRNDGTNMISVNFESGTITKGIWNGSTIDIAHGGTGATTRLGALKNLTSEDVGTNANYFLTITSNWGKGGYTSVANAQTVLGLGGIQGRPDYTISKTDLTDGTSALASGKLYLVYE